MNSTHAARKMKGHDRNILPALEGRWTVVFTGSYTGTVAPRYTWGPTCVQGEKKEKDGHFETEILSDTS